MRKTLVAIAALGLAALTAPASAATVFDFNIDGLTGTPLGAGPYGTVTVSGTSSLLNFVVQLGPHFYFNQSTSFQAFDMFLGGSVGTITIADVNNLTTASLLAGFTPAGPGSYTAPSIVTNGDPTKFNYSITCSSAVCGGGGAGLIDELTFNVSGTGLVVDAISNTKGDPGVPIYFAADIANRANLDNVLTGNIGATLGAVPEPATWALFILGFGFVGTMLRSARKRGTLQVA